MAPRPPIPSGVQAVRVAQSEPQRSQYMATRSEAAGHIIRGKGLPEDLVVRPVQELAETAGPWAFSCAQGIVSETIPTSPASSAVPELLNRKNAIR